VVNWVAPQGSRSLTYTVVYNTIPASNDSQIISGITGLTHTFSNFQVFDTPCVVAVQSMDTMTGLTGSFSSSNCSIIAFMQPNPPVVTNDDISYDKVFRLKWLPPPDPNGFILEYVVMLVNSTADSRDECSVLCNNTAGGLTTIRVRPEITCYVEVLEVLEDTCFCARVNASNSAGSAQSNGVFLWYDYESPPAVNVTVSVTVTKTVTMVQPTTQPPTQLNTGSDDDDAPIVAIILAVVLVAVVIATVVLGLVFCKMYLLTRETNNEKPKVYS